MQTLPLGAAASIYPYRGCASGCCAFVDIGGLDELELMDETEVQASVTLGRVQQLTMQAVEII